MPGSGYKRRRLQGLGGGLRESAYEQSAKV